MTDLSQGDLIRVKGVKTLLLVASKNAFIRATGMVHACPVLENEAKGPLHIPIEGVKGTRGVVACEHVKLIDPASRGCRRMDRIPYETLMDVSDAIQGMFEYD